MVGEEDKILKLDYINNNLLAAGRLKKYSAK